MMRLSTKKVLGSGLIALALGSGIGALQAQAAQRVEQPTVETPHYVSEPAGRCADTIHELEVIAQQLIVPPITDTADQPAIEPEPTAGAC